MLGNGGHPEFLEQPRRTKLQLASVAMDILSVTDLRILDPQV